MDLRVMGTREECSAFSDMIRKNVDKKFIRSISGWYANNRRGSYSTEGRVYINFRDFTSFPLEGPKELPEAPTEDPKEAPTVDKKTFARKGQCYYCGSKGDLMVLMWDNDRYRGACDKCARKYMDQQWIGNALEKEYPEIWEGLYKKTHPKFRGIFHDPNGYQEIWF